MKIVIDANVFISAIISGKNPRAVIDRVAGKLDVLLITEEIIDEVENVIKRPKFKNDMKYAEYIVGNLKNGEKVAVSSEHRITDSNCTDPKDIMYLECAVAGGADYIVSGDMDLRELKEYRGVRIVNPREYLEIVEG